MFKFAPLRIDQSDAKDLHNTTASLQRFHIFTIRGRNRFTGSVTLISAQAHLPDSSVSDQFGQVRAP